MDLLEIIEKNNCVLILHDSSIEASTLCTVYSNYVSSRYFNTYIVTHVPEDSANNMFPTDTTKILTYQEFDLEKNNAQNIYIFDNLNHIIGLADIKKFTKNNKAIILFTLGVSEEKVKSLSSFPILFSEFSNYGLDISFNVNQIQMTALQTIAYLEAIILLNNTSQKNKIHKESKVEIQKFCNIYFDSDLDTENNLILDKNFYLDSTNIDALLEHSPKFKTLISFLKEHNSERHFIFTRFKNEYGLKLLKFLIKAEGFDLYVYEDGVNLNTVLDDFNSKFNAPRVFLTNLVITTLKAPVNIQHLHMVDGSLGNTSIFIDRLYKYNNYRKEKDPNISTLNVINYVSIKYNGDENTIDVEEYEKERVVLSEKIDFYTEIYKISKKIYKENNFLIVIDN